jgi:hypothetical protein
VKHPRPRGAVAEGLVITHPDDLHRLTVAWTDKPVGTLAP